MYLGLPLIIALLRLCPRQARYPPPPAIGITLMCAALGLSSLSQTTTHLIVTQGILYAVGGSVAYCPCILYMDEWFVRRKGLAHGSIMWSGTGLGGITTPLLLEFLLGRYGFRTTLRIWAAALFAANPPARLLHEAPPAARRRRPRQPAQAQLRLQPDLCALPGRQHCRGAGLLPARHLPALVRARDARRGAVPVRR